MNKKFTAGAIFLLAILIIRMLMQLLPLVAQDAITGAAVAVSLFFALVYLSASIGVARKQRWGSAVALIISFIDLFSALALGGASAIGAGAVDVLILFLAYRQFKMTALPQL
ncbi:MAG: hypothetical protein HY422_00330 [Candidatus Komeilibacteria bacterium]|nr:hypothetical protein [Candidatus Komeilibacteria bacterium]